MSKLCRQYGQKSSSFKKALHQYTKEEVAKHTTDKDLWVIISGKVYNFSGYAKSHPGGADVFFDCAGKDATEIYEDSEHPAWVEGQMSFYLIGELTVEEPETT